MLECLVPIYAYSYIMILCRIFSPRHSFLWPLYLSCGNDFFSFHSHVYDSYMCSLFSNAVGVSGQIPPTIKPDDVVRMMHALFKF